MITRVTSYKASDGTVFEDLEWVQRHEIALILSGLKDANGQTNEDKDRFAAATAAAMDIVKHKERILDILTTGPRTKPHARSVNGGKKNRAGRTIIPTTRSEMGDKLTEPVKP